jgi:hypothetical protein
MSKDLMTLLAEARPQSLDRESDPTRMPRELGQIFTEPPSPVAPRRLITRARGAGLGLVATAVAVTVALVLANSGPAPAPSHPHVALGSASPAAVVVLSDAAAKVELASATTGPYWMARTRNTTLEQVGTPGHHYVIKSEVRQDEWTAGSPTGTGWSSSQDLGAAPATGKDVAAWKKAGSPATWSVPQPSGGSITYTAAGSKPYTFSSQASADAAVFALGGIRNVSVHDLQTLPADPSALLNRLAAVYQDAVRDAKAGNGPGPYTTLTPWLFGTAASMLSMPVTPAVRATLYRLMSGLNGVTSLGVIKDADGRTGNAVALDQTDENGLMRYEVIIDRHTGLPLAQQSVYLKAQGHLSWLTPKDVWLAHLVDAMSWTNEHPDAS